MGRGLSRYELCSVGSTLTISVTPKLTMSEGVHCPVKVDCQSQNLTGYQIESLAPNNLAFVSDITSCAGSLSIILLYLAWKELRTVTAQSIITFLAVADLSLATIYVAADIATWVSAFDGEDDVKCNIFYGTWCPIITYLIMCAISASFFWTTFLAFHFYLISVLNASKLARKLMPLYHVIAWGVPVIVGLPFLALDQFAYAPFVSAVWCIVGNPAKFFNKPFLGSTYLHVGLKLPEIIGLLFILLLYITTIVQISKGVSSLKGSGSDLH